MSIEYDDDMFDLEDEDDMLDLEDEYEDQELPKWNPLGYAPILEQMEYEDDDEIDLEDLDLGSPLSDRPLPDPVLKEIDHGQLAIDFADELYSMVDTTGLTGVQQDILGRAMRYGLIYGRCHGVVSITRWEQPKYNLKYTDALSSIEGENKIERDILYLIHNGVITGKRVEKIPRSYKGQYLYEIVEEHVINNPEEVEEVLREIVVIWLENIEDYDDQTIWVCYEGRIYKLNTLLKTMGNQKRVEQRGVGEIPYTLSQLLEEYKYKYSPQEIVDIWEESYEDHRELVGSGKNKKIYKYSFFN